MGLVTSEFQHRGSVSGFSGLLPELLIKGKKQQHRSTKYPVLSSQASKSLYFWVTEIHR